MERRQGDSCSYGFDFLMYKLNSKLGYRYTCNLICAVMARLRVGDILKSRFESRHPQL